MYSLEWPQNNQRELDLKIVICYNKDMKVEVYRNLHQKCWSVRDCKTGKVVDHVQKIHLEDAELVVRPAGRAKVLREQRKNVHAFVRGWISSYTPSTAVLPLLPTKQITYNPYKYDSFVLTETEAPVHKATNVFLIQDGTGWIYV